MTQKVGPIEFEYATNYIDLNAELDKIRKSIRGVSDTATQEVGQVNSTLRQYGSAVAAYFTVDFAASFISQIAQVRGEFEKAQAVLSNTLGSDTAAQQSMDMLSKFATTTPFQLTELTDAYVKLVNQGFKPTQTEMRKLGDLASSTGKGFGQLAEAIMDAQTGEFERLKEFGILASKQGDQVTFSFKGIQTQVDFTNESIRSYILSLGDMKGVAGANEKIAATIAAQISNLGDAYDRMLNQLGQANTGIFSSAIDGASYMLEHYQDIIDILKVLIITYGSYKAVIIASAAIEKARAIAAQVQQFNNMTAALTRTTQAQILLDKAGIANPYAAAAAAIGLVVTSLVMLTSKMNEATATQKALANINNKVDEELGKHQATVQRLVAAFRDEALSIDARKKAYNELKAIIPDYNAEISKEGRIINENKAAIDEYIKSLEKQIRLKATQDEFEKAVIEKRKAEKELEAKLAKEKSVTEKNKVVTNNIIVGGEHGDAAMMNALAQNRDATNEVTAAKKNLAAANKVLVDLQNELNQGLIEDSTVKKKTISLTLDYIDKQIAGLKDQQKEVATTRKQYDALQNQIEAWQAKRNSITGDKKADAKLEKDAAKTLKASYEFDREWQELMDKADQEFNDQLKKESEQKAEARAKEEEDTLNSFNELLEANRTYEQKRGDLTKEWDDKIAELKKWNYNKEAAEAEKKKKNALNALQAEHEQEIGQYSYLFDNIERMGAANLQSRINRLRQDLESTALTAEQKLAIEKALAEAEDKLIDKAPMRALASIDKRIDKSRKLRTSLKEALEVAKAAGDAQAIHKIEGEIDKLNNKLLSDTSKKAEAISKHFDGVREKLEKITGKNYEWVSGIGKVANLTVGLKEKFEKLNNPATTLGEKMTIVGDFISEAGESVSSFNSELGEAISLAGNLASALGQFASGNYIGGAISLISTGLTYVLSKDAKQRAAYEKQKREEIEAINRQIEATNRLYEAQTKLLDSALGLNKLTQMNALWTSARDNIGKTIDKLDELQKKLPTRQDPTGRNRGGPTQKKDLDLQLYLLKYGATVGASLGTRATRDRTTEQLDRVLTIDELLIENQKRIDEWLKKVESGVDVGDKDRYNEVLKIIDEYQKYAEQLEQIANRKKELLTGNTYDEVKDGLKAGFEDGFLTAEERLKSFGSMLKKEVMNSLDVEYLQKPMKEFYNKFAQMRESDGSLSSDEILQLQEMYKNIAAGGQAYLDQLNEVMKGAGIDLFGTASDTATAMAGAIKGITADQADVLSGQVSGMRYDIRDIVALDRQQLGALQKIEQNTAPLEARLIEVVAELKGVKEKMSSSSNEARALGL